MKIKPLTVETIGALPDALQDALGFAAIGQDGWAKKGALRQLERRGLVQSYEEILRGDPTSSSVIDRMPIRITRYAVPVHVHIVWSAWCSTVVEDIAN